LYETLSFSVVTFTGEPEGLGEGDVNLGSSRLSITVRPNENHVNVPFLGIRTQSRRLPLSGEQAAQAQKRPDFVLAIREEP
jgi:hypothetical protein